MKRIITIIFAALALSGLLLSCTKENTPSYSPVLVLSSDSFTVYAEGGNYSFSFDVENAASDGSFSCSGDVSWITVTAFSDAGTANFTVAKNAEGSLRTGNITLTYRYSSDSEQYVRKKIGVVQYGSSVRLTVPAVILIPADGGECSFDYELDGVMADNHDIRCSSDEAWLGDFDCSVDGTVRFTAEHKFASEMRSAAITVTYIDIYGQTSAEATVIQDHPHGEADVDLSDIVGTYTASGTYYSDSNGTDETWNMTFIQDETYSSMLWIDGLLPDTVGDSEYGTDYLPYCTVSEDHSQIIVQLPYISPSTATSSNYYRGFLSSKQWGSSSYDPLKFTYDAASDAWTSDYGVMYGLFWYQSVNSIVSMNSSVLPTITIRRASSN